MHLHPSRRAAFGFAGPQSALDGHCISMPEERTAMNANWTLARRVALGLSLAIVLASCASNPTSPPPEITQRIAAAQTRSDHESLATYFAQEATRARAAAASHRQMARSYQNRPIGERGSAGMVTHCNALAQSYDNSASMYDDMAASHRQMAAQARP